MSERPFNGRRGSALGLRDACAPAHGRVQDEAEPRPGFVKISLLLLTTDLQFMRSLASRRRHCQKSLLKKLSRFGAVCAPTCVRGLHAAATDTNEEKSWAQIATPWRCAGRASAR